MTRRHNARHISTGEKEVTGGGQREAGSGQLGAFQRRGGGRPFGGGGGGGGHLRGKPWQGGFLARLSSHTRNTSGEDASFPGLLAHQQRQPGDDTLESGARGAGPIVGWGGEVVKDGQ